MDGNRQLADALASAMQQPEETPAEPVEQEPAETPEDVVAETTETSDEELEINTVSDLMRQIEAEPDWFYGLNIDYGDGVEVPDEYKTLGGLKDSAAKLLEQRTAFEEQQRQFVQERDAYMAQVQGGGVQPPEELQQARAQLMQLHNTLNNTDWSEFNRKAAENGQEVQAIRYRQDLQDAYNKAAQTTQQLEGDFSQKLQQDHQQKLQYNMQKLMEAEPDLNTPEAWRQAQADMVKIGSEFGYSPEELSAVTDYRALRVLRTLSRLMGKDRAAQDAVRKTMKAPKALKPGAAGQKFSQKQLEAIKRKAKSPNATKRDKEAAISAVAKRFGI